MTGARAVDYLARDATAPRVQNAITSSAALERMLLRGDVGASGVSVTVDKALSVPAFDNAVRFLSETTAQLPLIVARTQGDRRIPADKSQAWQLLKVRPNEDDTPFEWRRRVMRDVLLHAYHVSLKVRSVGGRVVALIPLEPDAVLIRRDDTTMRWTFTYHGKTGYRKLDPADVFWFRSPSDMSIIDQFRDTIGEAIAMQRHAALYFRNGAKPGGLLKQAPGTELGQDARVALRDDFERMHAGDNSYKTAMLPAGIEYEAIAQNNRDAQYIEARRAVVTDIARMFRLPSHIINDLEKATFSNIEQLSIEVVKYSLMPWLVALEQRYERELVAPGEDVIIRHNASGLLRGDAKTRAEALQIQHRNGVISANEWRKLEDADPRDGGDHYIIESNMTLDDADLLRAREQGAMP